ncbi:MAG: MarR family transcriptional regulator [Thermomicrobiales bacterium]
MDERDSLIRQISDLTNQFDRTLRRSMPIDWPDVELTMPQLKTLASLLDGPLRMGDISAQSGISHSAATAMIDRLVDKDLVSRSHDQDDRRVVICELTAGGRDLLERFWRLREDSLRQLANHMTDEELKTVVDAMKIMNQAAHRNSDVADA